MLVLGIDPGTHCGFAVIESTTLQPKAWGTWELKQKKTEGSGMRYVNMRNMLTGVFALGPKIEKVGYEDVKMHLGVIAAHVYGGLVATLTAFCEDRKVSYVGIPVGTVKKRATAKGNADKEAMIAAAKANWSILSDIDDNTADALWIAVCTAELK